MRAWADVAVLAKTKNLKGRFVVRAAAGLPFLLEEGDEVAFGNQRLSVLYTPGHCDGSICLYNSENQFVITGDLIFELSVGRSDLPTGSEPLLLQSIREKILTLPDEVTLFPGHGFPTTVGKERRGNPFIQM